MLSGSKKNFCLTVVSLIALVVPALLVADDQARLKVMPVDESDRDPTLVQYLEKLEMAVRHREPERLVELVNFGVYNGPNKESGVQKFAEYWQVDSIESDIWSVLQPVLELGGGFVRSEKGVQYCAPYIFTEFPDNLDIYEHGAVLGDGISLMSEPSSSSSLVSTLSYDVVRVQDWANVPDMNQTPDLFWIKVFTLDGREGFVRRSEVRSPSEHSVCFLQNGAGVWKLTSLFSQIE